MKYYLTLFIILIYSLRVQSQNNCPNGQFTMNNAGFTDAQSIEHTSDGGFIIAGITNVSGAGQQDVFVAKYNAQNNLEWSNTFGTTQDEKGFSLKIIQSTNGYALTFNSMSYGSTHGGMVIMNIDNIGNILWQKKINNSSGYSHGRYIFQDNQDNFILSGSVGFNSGFGLDDAYLMKIDINGNTLWSTTFGTSSHDHSHSAIQLNDNSYIYGAAIRVGSNYQKLIIKISNNGTFVWAKKYRYHNGSNELFSDFKQDSSGNILAVGYSGNNFIITKMDDNGNHIWSKEYSGTNTDIARAISLLANDEIIIAGKGNSFGNGIDDLFISKLDENGNEIFTNYYGGNSNETFYGAAKPFSINELDNRIYLFGNTFSFGGNDSDPYIVITDLDGYSNCNSSPANWTITSPTPTITTANGSTGTLGSFSNSNVTKSIFSASLDSLCTSPCDTQILVCTNSKIIKTLCDGDSTQINFTDGNNYLWSPNYNISNNTIADPILFPTTDTTYTVSYSSIDGCSIVDTVEIQILDSNFVSIIGDDTICQGENTTLTAIGSGNFLWSTGEESNDIIVSPTSDSTFSITAGSGSCLIAKDSFSVFVNQMPLINTNSPIYAIQGETVDLLVDGASNYIWSPTIGLSCIDCNTPNIIANESTIYYVSGSMANCFANDSIEIIVTKLADCIEIPNAFTPNQDDVNNTFYPISITDNNILSFKIYNRWGENIHDLNLPWDGFYKGEKQPNEVYIYYINYLCNGEEKSLMGNVTLIR